MAAAIGSDHDSSTVHCGKVSKFFPDDFLVVLISFELSKRVLNIT